MSFIRIMYLWMFIVVATLTAGVVTHYVNTKDQQPTYSSKFKSGACFVSEGLREPWQVGPEGVIVFHGYLKYLVMFAPEAEQVGGGTKIGAEVDIVEFDKTHKQVECPLSWRLHTHEDRKTFGGNGERLQ